MKTFCVVLWLSGLSCSLCGQVLLKEDFSKKTRFPDETWSYHHQGAYHIYSNEDQSFFEKSKNYKDFTAEIRTEFISGDTAAYYGLLFRHDAHVNGYSFIISAVGHYCLQRSYLKPGGGVGDVEVNSVVYGTADSVFNKKGVNYLKVECSGNIIRLFINGYKIDSVADATIPEGIIGFRAWKGVHVHFDDLTVYRKNIPGKYSFKTAIQDSAFDEKNDSLTVRLINFSKPALWKDIPAAFQENGLYRIDSSAYINNYIYYTDENFSFRAVFKIRDWPMSGEFRISWYPEYSEDETEIGIIGDSTLRYVSKPAGIRYTIRNFPFLYKSGTLVRLQIDKKDADTKISVDDKERVLINDESYVSKIFKWIEFRAEGIGIDLFSVKVSKFSDEEYGLGTKDISCPVIRVSGNKNSGSKPALGDDSRQIPEADSIFSSPFFMFIIISAAQLLLIIVIIRWYKSRPVDRNRFAEYLRERNGSFLLKEFSARFRMKPKKAEKFLELMTREYQGYLYPVTGDKDAFYDFPSFMSDAPKTNVPEKYPELIEKMIAQYGKKISLPYPAAHFYFVQICALAAHLQGRLSVHTLLRKIDDGSFELDRSHFSRGMTNWDIASVLMSKMIDVPHISLLSDDVPTVLKFHEDLMKHFQNQ